MVIDEAKCAQFVMLPKHDDNCVGCCWLPICLLTTCPIRTIKNGQIKCKIRSCDDLELTESSIVSQYNKGLYKDLTM